MYAGKYFGQSHYAGSNPWDVERFFTVSISDTLVIDESTTKRVVKALNDTITLQLTLVKRIINLINARTTWISKEPSKANWVSPDADDPSKYKE